MDLKKFKLGVGPMSPIVTDLCLEYSFKNDFPLLIISSRNQVDYDGGYAFSTPNLVKFIKNNKNYVKENVLICRDHCGPYFSDKDVGLDLEQALNRCFGTIQTDTYNGFDLLHIDVSRVEKNEQIQVAERLFNFALRHNPNVMFEYGSEDNNGNTNGDFSYYHNQISFLNQYKPNLKYFVAKTGSLTKHKQVGNFDNYTTRKITELVHNNNLLFKEHNADYLHVREVNLRLDAGVDCFNIAPQLGMIHTKALRECSTQAKEYYDLFVNFVLSQKYYNKWITSEVIDDETKFLVSAHYFFNSKLGIQLHRAIDNEQLTKTMREILILELDQYRLGAMNHEFV